MHDYEDYFDSQWPPTPDLLRDLLDEVCTDAYGDAEQVGAILTAFDDRAELPRPATLAGTPVVFESVEERDLTLLAQVTLRTRDRVSVPLEDVAPPEGTAAAFLVAGWRLWRGLDPTLPRAPAVQSTPAAPSEPSTSDWAEVEHRVQSLSSTELVALIGDLYAASHSNRGRVHQRVGLPPACADHALLAQSKTKLSSYVAPHHDDPFQLPAALDVIEHYSAATSDRRGTIELLVHCLECGNLASEAYGDLFSEFYETIGEVAWRCPPVRSGWPLERDRRSLPVSAGGTKGGRS